MEHGYRFAIVFALASEAVAIVTLTIVLIHNRLTAGGENGPRLAATTRPGT